MNNAIASSQVPETRSVDESVRDAHLSMNQAEQILAELYAEVTGYGSTEIAMGSVPAAGLVNDADRLASRLVAFVGELQRTRARIVSPNVQSLGAQQAYAGSSNASLTNRQVG